MTRPTQLLHRRAFLGATTWTVGGAVIAGVSPVPLLAAPAACYVNASLYADACGDWQVDDICMAYPPYALAMGAALPVSGATSGSAADVDRHWIV